MAVAPVFAVPLGQVVGRIDSRAAFRTGFGEQRLVVLLRRVERIRRHDLLARIIAVAVAPRAGLGRMIADDRHLGGAPLRLEAGGRVAPEIARIGPKLAVDIEVARREDVARQRRDAGRHRTVACGHDGHEIVGGARTHEHALAVGADDRLRLVLRRPAAPDALRHALQQHRERPTFHAPVLAVTVDVETLVANLAFRPIAKRLTAVVPHFGVP